MSRWWRPRSVRLRLTLWYTLSLTAILIVYAGGVFAFLRQNLMTGLDQRLHDDFEMAEEMFERGPGGALLPRIEPHHWEEEGHGSYVEVWSPEGDLLYRNGPDPASGEQGKLTLRPPDKFGYVSLLHPEGHRFRVLTERHAVGGSPAIIRVARSEEGLRDELRRILLVLSIGLPLAISVAGIGGYALARHALVPVGRMAEHAKRINAESLSERLPVAGRGDELGQLALVFNDTFARLERSFDEMRRFTADASHELRTPLTAVRSVGEVGLRGAKDAAAYRDIIGSMLEEVDRLTRLVDSLLTLSRQDAGHVVLNRERVDLIEIGREATGHLGTLAEEKGQRISVEGQGPVYVMADVLVLRQAVINLVDNAIKYSPDGESIRIRVDDGSTPQIEVTDRGPGIALEHRDRVFERFYRVDHARSRSLGGCGLGLSIARWAVEAHGGHIDLESREGEGSTFRIVLPQVNVPS